MESVSIGTRAKVAAALAISFDPRHIRVIRVRFRELTRSIVTDAVTPIAAQFAGAESDAAHCRKRSCALE
jgi:hypothetical protein